MESGSHEMALEPAGRRQPFPFVRLVLAIAFGAITLVAVHVLFLVALVQFVVLAANGRPNAELKTFSGNLARYVWELLSYVCFARDEQPFPLGPFPASPSQMP